MLKNVYKYPHKAAVITHNRTEDRYLATGRWREWTLK